MNTINRWIQHWQALPVKNRIGAALCIVALIACIIALACQIGGLASDIHTATNPAAAHGRIQSKVQPLLEQADRRAAQLLDKHLASIHAFLDQRKAGSRAFAERMLSIRGKWEALKSLIGDDSDYTAFLQEAFAEHLFPMDELKKVVDAAVRSYLAELESIDDDLLVRLRADLGDDALPRIAIPALSSEQALRNHYHELSQRVAQDMRFDLAVLAGRELFSWPAGNIATDLTMQVGAALATRLGISTALFEAGAASTWETLGISLIVSFVLDAVIDRIIKAAGYDAEQKIAERVEETLSGLGRTITDGDANARAALETLKAMQRAAPDTRQRAECAQAIQSIETGTQLYGLRHELTKISAARASLRRETLWRLIHESE